MRTTVVLFSVLCIASGASGSTDPLTFVGFQRDMYIDRVADLALSSDGRHVYIAADSSSAISVFARNTTTGALSWRSAVRATDLAPLVLEEPESLFISPDGGHVYVAALNGLSVFEIDLGGDLTFLEVHRDGEGGLTTLAYPRDVAVSPDNKHVYVAAQNDNSLTVFSRDRTTGLLTYIGSHTDGVGGVDGLSGARAVAISPDGGSVYVTSTTDDAIAVFDRNPVTGLLTFFDVYKNSYVGIDGLRDPYDVMVSADGANVYTAGYYDGTIAVFERNAVNGLLTFLEVVEDGSGGVNHLDMVRGLAGSADGEHLYAVSHFDNAVTVFARSPVDGTLSQQGIEEFDTPTAVNLAGDGSAVIVGTSWSGITALSRNPTTGLLTQVDHEPSAPGLDGAVGITAAFSPCVYVAGNGADSAQSLARIAADSPLMPEGDFYLGSGAPSGTRAVATSRTKRHVYLAGHDSDEIVRMAYSGSSPCVVASISWISYVSGSGGILGLNGPQHLALSPDEAHLYVASSIADAVVVFSRDLVDGSLTFVGTAFDGVGANDGLNGAYWVEPSPDGAHLYVAGYYDNAIAVFVRNPSTGTLTFHSVLRDGIGGVNGLAGASSVALSPDGLHAYAAGRNDDSVAIFSRSLSTGALTYLGRVIDGIGGVDGLNGARAVAVSPDGQQVYAVGQLDHALAVFSRNPTSGLLSYVGVHKDGVGGVNGLNTANGVAVSPDGIQVHVTGYNDNAVATFTRTELVGIFSDDFESGNTIEWSSTVGGP